MAKFCFGCSKRLTFNDSFVYAGKSVCGKCLSELESGKKFKELKIDLKPHIETPLPDTSIKIDQESPKAKSFKQKLVRAMSIVAWLIFMGITGVLGKIFLDNSGFGERSLGHFEIVVVLLISIVWMVGSMIFAQLVVLFLIRPFFKKKDVIAAINEDPPFFSRYFRKLIDKIYPEGSGEPTVATQPIADISKKEGSELTAKQKWIFFTVIIALVLIVIFSVRIPPSDDELSLTPKLIRLHNSPLQISGSEVFGVFILTEELWAEEMILHDNKGDPIISEVPEKIGLDRRYAAIPATSRWVMFQNKSTTMEWQYDAYGFHLFGGGSINLVIDNATSKKLTVRIASIVTPDISSMSHAVVKLEKGKIYTIRISDSDGKETSRTIYTNRSVSDKMGYSFGGEIMFYVLNYDNANEYTFRSILYSVQQMDGRWTIGIKGEY